MSLDPTCICEPCTLRRELRRAEVKYERLRSVAQAYLDHSAIKFESGHQEREMLEMVLQWPDR